MEKKAGKEKGNETKEEMKMKI